MHKWYFWLSWQKKYKNFYWFTLAILAFCIIYFIYSYFEGINNVIHWETVDNISRLRTSAYSFAAGNIKLDIPLDNFVIFQYFKGSALTIYPGLSYVYLIILILCVNLIMSLLPGMSKFWFYAGMGGFIGFMVLFQLNQIELFGKTDKSALIIVLALYLSAGYYFREYSNKTSIIIRYIVFTLISILLGMLFYFYSGVEAPFLYLANYGIFGPLILAVLFIFSVAHEIIYGFLYLVTNANTSGSRNSLTHFMIASLLFLSYVFITFMAYTRQIGWQLIYLNPFLILVFSTVIGIWGLKRRENLYSEIFFFAPTGALFYLAFASICLTTIAYIFSVGNDPLIEVFEDAILYAQIGFGIMFFMYIMANFSPLLMKNFQVVKIVYHSRIFPFFIFRIGGLVVVGYIFFESHFFPYYQSVAGYYNNIGDLFMMNNRLKLAGQYYKEASDYEFQNHRSNYALATIARLQKNKLDESYYFQNSILKRPTEYAYVNLSNVLMENNQYFEGLFKLKEGQEKFPTSYQILNNLGYFYSKTDIADSAFYYFNLASNAKRRSVAASNNIFALLPKSDLFFDLDSLENYYKTYSNKVGLANKLGMLNQYHLYDNNLNVNLDFNIDNDQDFVLGYNWGLYNLNSDDTLLFNHLDMLADSISDRVYSNRLQMMISVYLYMTHRTALAYQKLQSLGESLVNNDEYYTALAKLSIDQNQPRLAIEFLDRINLDKDPDSRLYLALAYMDAGKFDDARKTFQQLENSGDKDLEVIAEEYLITLDYSDMKSIDTLSDEIKYLLLRYRIKHPRLKAYDSLVEKIRTPVVKGLAYVERAQELINDGEIKLADEYFDKYLELNAQSNNELRKKSNRVAYLLDIYDPVKQRIINPGTLRINDPNFLYDLLLYVKRNNDTNDSLGLDKKYRVIGTWDPFFEPGIIAAVNYYFRKYPDGYKSYNLLTDALNYNPYSIELNKKLVDICLKMGLLDYAYDELMKLQQIMEPMGYQLYRDKIEKLIETKQNEINPWGQ